MPLDPQARRLIDALTAAGLLLSPDKQVAELRRITTERSILDVQDREIPGPGGPIPVRIYLPPGMRPAPVLVYFHGGGWVIGGIPQSDTRCRVLAEWGGCIVVSVDY